MNEYNNQIPDELKKKIVDKLKEKGVTSTCPMCSHNNFILVDGFFNNVIQNNYQTGLILGGPTLPTIAIICTNCGFTSHHALGALDLLPLKEEKK